MSIISTDVLLRTAIEAGVNDLRKNPWILEDLFGGLSADPLSQTEYGYKEIKAAKKWFLDNNIPVYLPFRIDNPTMPCISITQESSAERADRASLADDGSVEDYEPHRSTSQPQMVIPPFSPSDYDSLTGTMTLPDNVTTELLSPGQFLVSARSGKAYVIKQILGSQDFKIAEDTVDDFEGAYIVPPTSLWNLHREQAFLGESFDISVHASSDPVLAMWLRQLVMYILFRYREVYLEARGFEISSLSAGPVIPNPNFNAEKVYSASIKLEGQIEASWIKFTAPKLYQVHGEVLIADGPKTPPTYQKQAIDQGWRMANDGASIAGGETEVDTDMPEIEEEVVIDAGLLGEDDT